MHQPQPERSYTLSGDGYGGSSVPPLPEHQYGAGYQPHSIDTNVGGYGGQQIQTSPVKGPRPQPGMEDAPPGYEPSPAGVSGNWGKR